MILVLDQGTTSSKAQLFDRKGVLVCGSQKPFSQLYPKPGWVEHDPMEILSSQVDAFTEVMDNADINPGRIAGIGISNQRETAIIWDRETGLPVANAIVWQCRRTAEDVERICADPEIHDEIVSRTGLIPDAYFSASKIAWIMNNVSGAREAAEQGRLAFGTVDSWLIYKLTGGKVHATDVTSASRTMLFNIRENRWDEKMLELFGIPVSLLPEVRPSACDFGLVDNPSLPKGLRICGMAGDQQAALFGQRCFGLGAVKCTMGTGSFMLMHTGDKPYVSKNRLVTTVAASAPGQAGLEYALEGSIFVAGGIVQWLSEGLGIIKSAGESEALASSVADTEGVYVVPAFTGLGAPWWDPEARGAIIGLAQGAKREHVVRAALESLAYQTADLISAFESDAGVPVNSLKVDGGVAANGFLMQFMSDILNVPVSCSLNHEATGLGAAFLAGLTCGFWSDTSELLNLDLEAKKYAPATINRQTLLDGWHAALARVRTRQSGTYLMSENGLRSHIQP